MLKDSCLFCKILRKEVSFYKVYEDSDVLAFLDIHPCAKGHTVVIPKQHYESLKDMSDSEWRDFMRGLNAARNRIEQVLAPEGLNAGINERAAAGQAVPHVHWHIIPRWEGDGGGSMHSIIKAPKEAIDVPEVAMMFTDGI
ncbi:MAG: HIT family protein [Candidatus Magasanikbacteria bacterium]|nr:HIT family protein [Candidatus Magasanikbacteria bacterium]